MSEETFNEVDDRLAELAKAVIQNCVLVRFTTGQGAGFWRHPTAIGYAYLMEFFTALMEIPNQRQSVYWVRIVLAKANVSWDPYERPDVHAQFDALSDRLQDLISKIDGNEMEDGTDRVEEGYFMLPDGRSLLKLTAEEYIIHTDGLDAALMWKLAQA